MNPYKAPGPNGFQRLFYQKFWPIVGSDLASMVLNCLNHKHLPAQINETFLSLIPKTNCTETLMHFRSISLCNVVYKTITKTIVNLLKSLLPKFVSPSQTSFIPGRNISDNVIIFQEVLHSFRKKKGRAGDVMIKLDLEKAYDRLDWAFIEDTFSNSTSHNT